MKLSDLKNSRFLTKEDCDPPILVTVSHVDQQNVAPADQQAERKWCLHFKEAGVKPLVLNGTNGEIIGRITGSDDSDNWVGVQVVAYHDPNVEFRGKLVGGVRLRAPRPKPAAQTAPQSAPQPAPQPEATTADFDDSVPW